MRYMGIDFGSKRVGIAVSDPEGKMAFPYSVILNDEKIFSEIEKIIATEGIEVIVLGESKNFEGQPNKIMVPLEKFGKIIADKSKLKIFFEPEFMTSAQAEHIQGKNKMHDASAASIILQSYLDRNQGML